MTDQPDTEIHLTSETRVKAGRVRGNSRQPVWLLGESNASTVTGRAAAFLFSWLGFWKRFFSGLFLLVLLSASRGATVQAEAIRFVYIHGTNQNTPESHQHFNQEVAGLHPYIKSALEKEPLVQAHFLDSGKLTIDPQTLNFFWGDKSHLAIEVVRRNVYLPQLNHGVLKLGERARKKMAFTLHDAIWVEQQTNKKAIISALFDQVSQIGTQPIMLMGHSAGSLVTFNFLLYRLPYIDMLDFAQDLHAGPAVMALVKSGGQQYTCLEALLSSSGLRYDVHGKLAPFFAGIEPQLPPELLDIYRSQWVQSMPRFTQQYCLPQNKVKGLVTFGSPLALFYSLAASPDKDESYLTMSMVYYMLSHNIVWLHVNHWDDFIALPLADKSRVETLLSQRLHKPLILDGGFVENYIYEGGGATFINAHSWYWKRPKAFADTVAKAYHDGYLTWYPPRGTKVPSTSSKPNHTNIYAQRR